MNSRGAAQRHATTDLCPGHAEHAAEHPKEQRAVVDIDATDMSMDLEGAKVMMKTPRY
jgi:hypothetical protein